MRLLSLTPYLTCVLLLGLIVNLTEAVLSSLGIVPNTHAECMCICSDKRFIPWVASRIFSSDMSVDARREVFWQLCKRRNKRLGASTPSHPFQGQGLLYTTQHTLLASCLAELMAGELRRPWLDSWVFTQGHLLRPLPLVLLIVVFSDCWWGERYSGLF